VRNPRRSARYERNKRKRAQLREARDRRAREEEARRGGLHTYEAWDAPEEDARAE
jgi:hypothetical protein